MRRRVSESVTQVRGVRETVVWSEPVGENRLSAVVQAVAFVFAIPG